jgi:ribosomal protein S18 acetylase RimI-like enzyme
LELFGCFIDGVLSGSVGYKACVDAGLYYIERLAVLPELRHQGLGRKLVDFAVEQIRRQGGRTAQIEIVDKNTRLKAWYQALGFKEVEVSEYPNLPFLVCTMELTAIK